MLSIVCCLSPAGCQLLHASSCLVTVPFNHAEATSEEHVKDNFAVLDWELSEEDMEALSSLETQNKNVPAAMFLKESGPYVTESDVRNPPTMTVPCFRTSHNSVNSTYSDFHVHIPLCAYTLLQQHLCGSFLVISSRFCTRLSCLHLN